MRDGRSGDVLIPDDTCGKWIDRVNWNYGIKESGEKQPGIEPGTGKKDLKNFCTIEKISHFRFNFYNHNFYSPTKRSLFIYYKLNYSQPLKRRLGRLNTIN